MYFSLIINKYHRVYTENKIYFSYLLNIKAVALYNLYILRSHNSKAGFYLEVMRIYYFLIFQRVSH